MRIRKLELYGFKSFPDRTVVEFGPGICCVVGPNGCGKSNIMDAIRWCIGEQSAKSLRGGDMADVIFAGSSERSPVGFAEVTIVLTADDGEPLPGEYARFHELSVGRRLHRSGASEYLINRERVRRKDVVDLFLDTGIGSNLYSFIEQGSIGKLVSASPDERRKMIEEAAGIAKYRTRRAEAQQRLEGTASQLDRAADVEEELAKRLKVVERQVFKAAHYRRLRARIKQREIVLSLARYADLVADRRRLAAAIRDDEAAVQRAEAAVRRHEVVLGERRDEAAVLEAVVASRRDDAAEQDARHRELEGAVAFQERRSQEIRDDLARLDGERARTEAQRAAAEEEIATATADVESLTAAREVAERDRVARAASIDDLVAARQVADAALHDASRLATAAEVRASEARARVEDLSARAARAVAAAEENRREGAEAVGLRDAAAAELEEARAASGRAEEAFERVTAEVAVGASDAEAALQAREQAREQARAARRRVDEAQRALSAVVDQGARRLRELESVGRAEERSARERGAAAVRDAEAAGRTRLAQEGREADQILREALAASAAGVEAAEKARRDALTAAQAESDGRVAAARRRWDEELAAATATARAELSRAEAAAGAERDQRAGAARSTRDERAAARERAGEVLSAARERLGQTRAALAGARARVDALGAQVEAARRRSVGAEEVAARLADAPRLGDRDDVPAWAPAVLGERLALPLLPDSAAVLGARAALPDGAAATVWLWRGGVDPWSDAARGIARCPDLAAALAHHVETGGAAVAEGSGERVDVDGVVHLGAAGRGGAELVALAHELDGARAEIEALAARERSEVAEVEQATVAFEQARQALVAAEEVLTVEAAQADRAWREATTRAREASEHGIGAVRAAREADLAALASEREARRAAAEKGAAEAVAAARAEAEARGTEARHAREARLQAARVEVEAALTQAREAVEAHVASARERTEAARAEAVAAIEAARAEASDRLSAAEAELREAEREAQGIETSAGAAERQRAALATRLREAEVARVQARSRVERLEASVAERGGRAAALAAAAPALEEEARRLVAERDGALRVVADADAGMVGPRDAMERARAALVDAEHAVERVREAISLADVEIASLRERAEGRRAAIEASRRRVGDAVENLARFASQRTDLEAAAEGVAAALRVARVERDEVAVERAGAWDRLQQERSRLDEVRAALRAQEEEAGRLTEAREEATRSLAEHELRRHEVQLEVEALRKRMDERYLVSLPGLLDRLDAAGRVDLEPDEEVRGAFAVGRKELEGVDTLTIRPDTLADLPLIERLVAEVEADRQALAALGEVNLAALEEYDEVKHRHDELAAQRADLEASVGSIKSAIAKMNKHCRERFRETFDLVNEHFQVAYPRLVGGGRARLALTDEEDLLAAGVEVFVQPPGKRLQNLTLLSGGEKAMTALAMIMSLFKVKPSPFCLLDEVDAPLDEANGARFNEMLREMSRTAQFIVITHNRKTMECADTLYGITMGQPGVSRLVSVQMTA